MFSVVPKGSTSRGIVDPKKLRNLNVNDTFGEDDLNILLEFEEEQFRRGGFELVFPLESNVDYYEKFFECTRYNNHFLWAYIRSKRPASIIERL